MNSNKIFPLTEMLSFYSINRKKYVMLVAVNMTLRLIARYIAVRFLSAGHLKNLAEWGLYVHTAEVRNMIRG